ncbi:MAG TPA: tRNA modification GTPase [Pirellulaceae bacterium]|nr:tRNA modification GTPase [Pirellulaceae bacterium]
MTHTLDLDDTIVAIASAPGGALRGIVRVSGPDVLRIVGDVFTADDPQSLMNATRPSLARGQIKLPRDLPPCPALVYLWPNERSYTRQPSAELHLPGSPPLLEAALEAVCQAGARLARPGEFTLRAFLAGRLDLTQAEAVLGVIDARGQAELNRALAQLAGGLAQPLHALRDRLLDLLAHLEAGLDFVDEDIEFISSSELEGQLAAAAGEVAALARQMTSRGEAGKLPRVILVGRPNAGKSSLFNALAGGDAAIVSPVAGTTRDYVTCRVQQDGCDFLLVDTAGDTAEASDPIAAAAQAAMREQAEQADLILVCVDASRPMAEWEGDPMVRKPALFVWTKCDVAAPGGMRTDQEVHPTGITTSSRTGQGIAELRRAIAMALQAAPAEASAIAGTAERCRDSLRVAFESLQRAQEAAGVGLGEELVAAEVRMALDALGQVVGAVYTDDVLDRVFSRFCIGK